MSQASFFALFLGLLLQTHASGPETIGPVERFLHFDPLLGLATGLASRSFQAAYGYALITVAVTALFGRYVCGWVCPLGSLLHFFSFLFAKWKWTKPRTEPARPLRWKYLILLFVLVASVFAVDFAGFLDPLSLLYRSFSTALLPAVSHALEAGTSLLQCTGTAFPGDGWREFIHSLMIHPTYRQGVEIGVVFLGVILLNLVRPRFWCRYICPAGALLGVIARWHPFKLKIAEGQCNHCQLCSRHCPSQAGPSDQWQKAECFHCFNCASRCPQEAIRFPLTMPAASSPGVDLSRRELVLTSTLGLMAAPLLSVSASERPSEKLIRPPGALIEPAFLSKCIKCGECLKVCPTNGLQNASHEGSLLALWTPVLVPRIGYCEYECSLCSQVCPTGAIRELTVQQKQETKIGSAWIRKHRCAPYALGEPCRVCEQKCPTSPKAITMVTIDFAAPEGMIQVQAPFVDASLCIGCGLCETRCPMEDEPGIYCTNYGESRAQKTFALPEFGQ